MATNFSEQMELGSKIETTFCTDGNTYISGITVPNAREILQVGKGDSAEASLRDLVNNFNNNNEIRIC